MHTVATNAIAYSVAAASIRFTTARATLGRNIVTSAGTYSTGQQELRMKI